MARQLIPQQERACSVPGTEGRRGRTSWKKQRYLMWARSAMGAAVEPGDIAYQHSLGPEGGISHIPISIIVTSHKQEKVVKW